MLVVLHLASRGPRGIGLDRHNIISNISFQFGPGEEVDAGYHLTTHLHSWITSLLP